ncbi:pimeloyl-ACP methyl ester carboxylesterase [Litoreibacter meonggei]|uniref:Pimeloyl-ACP methyl ester carboxylesterase n=1 Tax=Litoreibacter meonggei TaxID=1049199 RepID=A0A497VA98_9RHOB|nr:alpha/beta fold hydrolase [Litoreibacter meonggei]RLJ36156.1 pimeloyl-ACP methyl ester carboxylesterase [Litoreibacter meonggei]
MTPLVLLPGMMCDARLFAPQIAAFSAERVVHFAPFVGDQIKAIAAQILSQAPPKFALAGLSMGGIVAMEVLRQAPERVERIALLDTNPLAESDKVKAMREPQIAKVQAGGLATVMRDEMKPNYLTDGPRRAEILNLCMDMADAVGPEGFVAQSRALQTRPDQSATLQNCDVPALILCGREDALCPIHRHELMHSLMPQSTMHIVENAGHLPTLEQPDETTAALSRWLEAK